MNQTCCEYMQSKHPDDIERLNVVASDGMSLRVTLALKDMAVVR